MDEEEKEEEKEEENKLARLWRSCTGRASLANF